MGPVDYPTSFENQLPQQRLAGSVPPEQSSMDSSLLIGEATPKTMGVKGLALYHLKSHLQKCRLGKQSCKELPDSSKDASCIAESQDTGSCTASSSKLAQDLNER